jgi:hypothetical protein
MVAPAAFRRHRERGGESPPPSSSCLASPPRWEESFPSGPWPPWRRRGGSPSEIGYLSLCFSSVSRLCFLAFHHFLNSRRSVTPIGLKFWGDFYPEITFLAAKEGYQPTYEVPMWHHHAARGDPHPGGLWRLWASVCVDSTSQKSHIFQNNSP